MNLFLITKYKNRGKLSSHNWFFNGFCQELRPQYAVLLDVGLAPERKALWRMFNHMENNPKIGGVCGYMGLKIERVDQGE
jgi:chitin synthase